MRTLKRKGDKCKCPYCGVINHIVEDYCICEHLVQVIDNRKSDLLRGSVVADIVYYYFEGGE